MGLCFACELIHACLHPQSFDLFLEWDEFQGDDVNQKGDNPAETVRLLKEMAMDRATRSLFNATDPSVTPPTAAQVLDACVAHAMEASAGTRRLFADRSFVEGDNAEKSTKALARIREHIDLYFGSTESKRARTFKEYPAPKPERPEDWLAANYYMAKGKYWRKGFFLPEVPYVPHAKVDHLGIQVIKVEALKRAKNGTNGLE